MPLFRQRRLPSDVFPTRFIPRRYDTFLHAPPPTCPSLLGPLLSGQGKSAQTHESVRRKKMKKTHENH